ncbi:MAG: hypothetical protein JW774_04765 [Candidatus Aureabacteria bacterium]|nr:hypothetical protein [Candidatus Auribacterota bacterium]
MEEVKLIEKRAGYRRDRDSEYGQLMHLVFARVHHGKPENTQRPDKKRTDGKPKYTDRITMNPRRFFMSDEYTMKGAGDCTKLLIHSIFFEEINEFISLHQLYHVDDVFRIFDEFKTFIREKEPFHPTEPLFAA